MPVYFQVFNLGHFFNCYGTRCEGPFDGASHMPEVAGGMGTGNKSNSKYKRQMIYKLSKNFKITQSSYLGKVWPRQIYKIYPSGISSRFQF